MLGLDVEKEQALLEAPTRLEALRLVHGYLTHEVQVLELRQKIATQAQTEMGKEQREYMLRQQTAGHPGGAGRAKPGEGGGRRAAPASSTRPTCPTRCARRPSASLGRLERLPSARRIIR